MRRRVIERNMFYGANHDIFVKASLLRRNMTLAEKLLWSELRNREIFKERFKPQHPIDIFIVDFYCHKHKLAIEVDGEIHLDEEIKEYDDGRSHDIEKLGIRILRFTNSEVIHNLELVKQRILYFIHSSSPL
jgi:very-short-patch-repair endonuclease